MLVSVIIPTFNRADTVLESVESALNQTYPDLEVIIVDDGSTDRTDSLFSGMTGPVTLIRQENSGPSAARNRGAEAAKGELIAFLDSDDCWLPEKIERQVGLMRRAGPDICCCVCNATVTGVHGGITGRSFDIAGLAFDFNEGVWTNPQEVLSTRFLLFNQVVAIRRDAFFRIGGFNESLRLLEDYEMAVRLSTLGDWGIIRDPLVIKHNDTRGIGVECMTRRNHHTRVRAEVIGGILAGGAKINPRARHNLERQYMDLLTESKSIVLCEQQGFFPKMLGHLLDYQLLLRRAIRRRSPGWPSFQGHAFVSNGH